MRKKRFLILLCLVVSMVGNTQNLDSLLVVARQSQNDSVKLRMFNKIAFGYIFNNPQKALAVISEGKRDAKAIGFKFGLTELTNTHGIYMDVTGQSDSAGYYFEKALKMSRDYGFKNIESMCVNNLGMFNWNRANYDRALDYFFQSLKMNEAANDEKSTSYALNNIGLIYQEMNLAEKALEYHQKALKLREKYNLKNEQVASLNNIGINLKDLGRLEEAIETYKAGIRLAKTTNNLMEHYRLLDNLANAYQENGNSDLALNTYLRALEVAKTYEAGEKGVLPLYNNIAALYNSMDNPEVALNYAKKGFALVEKYPEIELIAADLYLTSAESYYMRNDFEKAREAKATYIRMKDSVFSEANAKAIADLEIKYETEKKEKEILVQRAELAEHKLTIQERNYQLFGLMGLALILALIGFLFYNQQKLRNKQLRKENELKDALLKIETQNRLQEQRLRISRDLHDNIGAQLTFIISSIDNLKYGFDIKDDRLTQKLEAISEFTSATIYELRDTIWAMNKAEISLEDLHSRISNFVEKANVASEDIDFKFVSDTAETEAFKLSSVKGMNVYRIVQEALNNAIKYSEAKHITVNFKVTSNEKRVTISDDGKGFDMAHVQLGNGLQNMKKRATEIGANFKMESNANQGTKITLEL